MRANAAKVYLGNPCKRGHGGRRYLSNSQCVECAASRQQARYRQNPEECKAYTAAYQRRPEFAAKRREYRLRSVYDLLPVEYYFMLAGQGFCCAVCEGDEPGGKGDWHVDHCHDTGKVRGILCNSCNTSLGKLGDNAAGLRRALAYLERFECKTNNSTKPTSETDGRLKASPHTEPNAKPQAGWSAGLL